jgi:sugar phosphate isomerase/epimerase
MDWAKFFAALTAIRYDYVVSVEHEDRAFEGSEDLVKRGFYLTRDILKPYIH